MEIKGLDGYLSNQPSVKISDISADTTEKTTLLVQDVQTKQDKNGNDFCDVFVSDGEKAYVLKMWNSSADKCGFEAGNILDAFVQAKEYRGNLSYILSNFTINADADASDFILGAPVPIADMWSWIEQKVASMSDPYRALLTHMILVNKDAYTTSAAARANHHAYPGGLLYHSYRMAKSAEAIAPLYQINEQLAIAGCLLHDIGKLRELSTTELGQAEYTIDGQLEYHTQIGIRMLDESALACGISIDSEEIRMLRHIIASHHGRLEFGAAALPATAEAILVSNLDNMDMRLTVWEAETSDISEGSCTTAMNGVLQTRAYRSTIAR